MEGRTRVWTPPHSPFRVECSINVLEQIRLAVVDAFFALPRGGLEIGGVLFGTWQEGRLRILAFRQLECEHALGPEFVLSEKDHRRLMELLAHAAADPGLTGLQPVGWYRSRTRSELQFSQPDAQLSSSYFPEPWQVALVLRPDMTRPTRAALYFRDASPVEFELTPAAAPHRTEPAPAAASEAPGIAAEPRPLPPGQGTLPEPRFLTTPSPWRGRLWFLLALCLSLAVAGYAVLTLSTPLDTVAVNLFERHGQLEIQWDRTPSALRGVSRARVDIHDGSATTSVDLDAAHLQRGSLFYVRRTEHVEIRLVLVNTLGRTAESYALFLGQKAPASVPSVE